MFDIVLTFLIKAVVIGGLLLAMATAYKIWAEPIIVENAPAPVTLPSPVPVAQENTAVTVELLSAKPAPIKTHLRTDADVVIYEGSLVVVEGEYDTRWQVLTIRGNGACKLQQYGNGESIKHAHISELKLFQTI